MIALAISLTLWFGPAPAWQLDVTPTFLLETQLPGRVAGFTLPHLIVVEQRDWQYTGDITFPTKASTTTHELQHAQQYEHLGPGFLLAYAITGGIPFEDYRQPDPWRGTEHNCPMIRLSPAELSFMPCWNLTS